MKGKIPQSNGKYAKQKRADHTTIEAADTKIEGLRWAQRVGG